MDLTKRQAVPSARPVLAQSATSKQFSNARHALGTGLVLLAATIWSLLTTPYAFAQGDDAWQAPMVIHLAHPELLNHDPLVTEVAAQYKSLLFVILAGLTRAIGLAEAYALVFAVNRFLTLGAFYHLARVVTNSRAAALLGTILLTGLGLYSFGTYLGGIPLLEEKVVPRGLALPAALMALAATIQRKHLHAAVWLTLAIASHPVTGANALGLYVLYNLFCYPQIAWRPFVLTTLFLAALFALFAIWTGQASAPPGDLRFDPQWRAVVVQTFGPWGFLLRDWSWRLDQFPMGITVGLLSVLAIKDSRLHAAWFKLAAAGLVAMVIHLIGVDGLGIRPLLEACPERATFGVIALSAIALGVLIAQTVCKGCWSGKIAGILFMLSVLTWFDYRVTFMLFLICLAVFWKPAWRWPWLVGGLAAAVLILSLPLGRPLSMSRLHLDGFRQLWSLGVNDPLMIVTQLWVRNHSGPDEVIVPPLYNSRGWQIFSERSCAFNSSFHTYTYLSKELSRRYTQHVAGAPEARRLRPWRTLLQEARQEGADWVIIDARDHPPHRGEPAPAFYQGPYFVYRTSPPAGTGGQPKS